jgi:putative hydrolase of the HAD superfamily
VARLALFDLDNTLIDRAAAFRAWAAGFVAERNLGGEDELAWLEQADGDGLTPRGAFFAAVCARYGVPDRIGDLVRSYRAQYPQCVRPPDTPTTAALAELRRRGWRIGIVSNGAPSQLAKIEVAGLADAVDGWAISELVGSRKPERAIFEAAAAACGCALDGGWVVGDSADADIAGAAACGLRSVWISRGRRWQRDDFAPDAVTETVADAVAHVLAG